MDRLEEHIRKNRGELDMYTPPPVIWRRIRREISPMTFKDHRWRSAAAIFLALVTTAVTFFSIGHNWTGKNNESDYGKGVSPSGTQLKETEIYYQGVINSLYREASPLLTSHPDIEKELSEDISHLDSVYIDIKKDLKDNVANQDVIEALIQNYRIRIKLLDDMLNMLKSDNSTPEKRSNYEM
jgi:hypothetical protein